MSIKVAVLGAGSFVFGPSVLKDAILQQRLDGIELALMDPNKPAVDLMAAIGQRMARESGVAATITAHDQRAAALDGAQFVICSAARQIWHRFNIDCEIVRRVSPDHQISEFGGIAGISYSLRQIALIQEIASDMKRLCPEAWLFDVANPMPRVAQAAHEEGIPTVGFCSVALAGYARAWSVLHGQSIPYPFEPARSRLLMTVAGLNHFTWVIRLRDSETKEDLYPALRDLALASPGALEPATRRILLETGYLLAPGDNHIKDFLVPTGEIPNRQEASHGTPEERDRRMELLRAIAEGRESWQPLIEHESWEKPINLVAAMAFGKTVTLDTLNLINVGQIPQLPNNVFVETPAEATATGPIPQRVDLPAPVVPACRWTAMVTDTIVRAARLRRKCLIHEAIELDPTILDKRAGIQAMEECLKAHADVLPGYH